MSLGKACFLLARRWQTGLVAAGFLTGAVVSMGPFERAAYGQTHSLEPHSHGVSPADRSALQGDALHRVHSEAIDGPQSEVMEEGASQTAHGGHGGPPEAINWWHGFLSEKEGVKPSLLFRPKGTPPPFAANLINFGLLVFLLIRFGKKPMVQALVKRKEDLLRGMEESSRIKAEAEKRLEAYKGKLQALHSEGERIRTEYAEQAKRERERIVQEARDKQERMRKEASFVLEQERKQAQQTLLQRSVDAATSSASTLIVERLSSGDQERLAGEYLQQLPAMLGGASRGGS